MKIFILLNSKGGYEDMKRRKYILLDACILLLALGLIYAYTIVMAPLAKHFSWSPSQLSMIYVLSIISFTIGNIIAGVMLKHMSVQKVFLYGAGMIAIGFIGSAFANQPYDLLLVYVLYGIVTSMGIGFVYNGILPTITAWFPDKVGLAQGTLLMSYGMGAFILGPLITEIYTAVPWRVVFVAIGIIFGLLVVASTLLIRAPQASDHIVEVSNDSKDDLSNVKDKDLHDMLKDPAFYMFYLWMIFLGIVGQGILGIGKSLPDQQHVAALLSAIIAGLVSLGNGGGRLLGGWLLGKIGRRKTMLASNCLFFVAIILLLVCEITGNLVAMSLGCLLCGMSFGSILVVMTYFTKAVWGLKNMALNFGVINSYGIPAVFIGSWGSSRIYEATGSYVPVFTIMLILAALALIDLFFLERYLGRNTYKS